MDIGALLKLKSAWDTFSSNHPKFQPFLNAVRDKGIVEGTMIDIAVHYPDGSSLKSGIKVRQSDLELLDTVSSLLE